MRELKFRGWDKEKMMMGSVMQLIFGEGYGAQIIYSDSTISFTTKIATDGHEIVLMQYTGLKDKTGKEIYEGDILKIDDAYYQDLNLKKGATVANVWYGDELAQFHIGNLLCNIIPRKDLSSKYYEIIGDVYETPELLKKD